jgi:hypothetical protein
VLYKVSETMPYYRIQATAQLKTSALETLRYTQLAKVALRISVAPLPSTHHDVLDADDRRVLRDGVVNSMFCRAVASRCAAQIAT